MALPIGVAWTNGNENLIKASWRASRVYANDRYVTNDGAFIISHEILHTLGLEHPLGAGSTEGFDWSDTTMSYNRNGLFQGMTELDKSALQELWPAV